MAGWGFVAGGIGFAGGQSIQAWHAWNPDALSQGWFAEYAPFINWWNTMETGFGTVMGAVLGLGLWKLDVQTDATNWFPPGTTVRDDYDAIRQRLSGISPVNVVIGAGSAGSTPGSGLGHGGLVVEEIPSCPQPQVFRWCSRR